MATPNPPAVPKTARQLERHFKGVSNHRRIDILLLLEKKGERTLEDIVTTFKGNQKTFSAHTLKLVQAGLVNKRYAGRNVVHSLSPYGRRFVHFIKTLSQS